jgi:hypothetical protein
MASPFDKTSVPNTVKTEITARQGKNGILWTAQRFPWIQIKSMSTLCTNYVTLDSKPTTALYEANYVRPRPVVTQVSVKKKGNLGTTKQVTVNITAFTDEQLIELQKCYFIPGLSVRGEWGWSIQANGLQKTSGPIDASIELDCLAIPAIIKKQDSDPSYSGVQGVVSNFSYNLTSENTWDCTLEITGVAEAFAFTSITDNPCNCPRKVKKEGSDDEVVRDVSPFLAWCIDLFSLSSTKRTNYLNQIKTTSKGPISELSKQYNGPLRKITGAEKTLFSADFFSVLANKATDNVRELFVNFAYVEAAANYLFAKRDKQPTSTAPFTGAVTNFVQTQSQILQQAINNSNRLLGKPTQNTTTTNNKCGSVSDLGSMNSSETLLKWYAATTSVDPRVCLLPGALYQPVESFSQNVDSCITTVGNIKYIKLYNIYVNIVAVYNAYQSAAGSGEPTIDAFFRNLLGQINDACANPWDFDIVSNTNSTTPELTIIDLNLRSPQSVQAYALPGKPANSILRSLNADLKLTEAMKTQAIYGTNTNTNNQKDQTNKCLQTNFQAFTLTQDLSEINKGIAYVKPTNPLPMCDGCEAVTDSGDKEKGEEKAFPTYIAELQKYADDESVAAARENLSKKYNNTVSTLNNCSGTPLPFNYKFSLDGIGGFKFGQMVTCDRIPQQVQKSFEFQVTSVSHTITVNDWITEIETIARPLVTNFTQAQSEQVEQIKKEEQEQQEVKKKRDEEARRLQNKVNRSLGPGKI